jgi:MFS family permease
VRLSGCGLPPPPHLRTLSGMSADRRTAALRYLSHSANDLFWFILPLVLPLLLVRFELSYARAGGILTYYLALTAVGSFVMGKLSDRIPRRLVMGIGFLVASAGLTCAAFAGSFVWFMAFLAVTAVGVSTFHPAMYAHIDETVTAGRRGRVLGTYEAFGTGAILLMFVVNGTLLESIGTRGVLLITAAPAVVMGILLIGARSLDAVPAPSVAESPRAAVDHPPVMLFVLFLVTIVLRTSSFMAVVNFLPTIFTDYFGFRADRAAYATALLFAGGIVGSLVASRFARPTRSYRVLVFGSLFIAPVIATLSTNAALGVHVAAVILLGSLGSALIISQNLILARLGSRFGRGAAFGILMGAMTLSQSVSPALFGLTVDTMGFRAALLIFSTPVLVSAGLLAFLSQRITTAASTQPVGVGQTEPVRRPTQRARRVRT